MESNSRTSIALRSSGIQVTFGEGVQRTGDTFAQVLEDSLIQREQSVTVKAFNYGTSAYSVKEMAATFQYRMLDIQPGLVVMAIIPSRFRPGQNTHY